MDPLLNLSISPNSKVMRRMLLLVCFISMISSSGYALTYYSRVATFTFAAAANNWSESRTGGTLVVYPGTGHDYIIQTGNNVTIGANQTAVSVTVESGGTLTAGAFTLTSPLTINSGFSNQYLICFVASALLKPFNWAR